jgi:hypothetical protein
MPVTMQDVRAALDPEEVDYETAKGLGAAAIPFLMELVQGGDLGLASKATYLASLIGDEQSVGVVEAAAARNEPVLKIAAASGIRNLSVAHADRMLGLLKDDPDIGVRKVALQSAAKFESPTIVAKLRQIAETDPEPVLRDLAANSVNKTYE